MHIVYYSLGALSTQVWTHKKYRPFFHVTRPQRSTLQRTFHCSPNRRNVFEFSKNRTLLRKNNYARHQQNKILNPTLQQNTSLRMSSVKYVTELASSAPREKKTNNTRHTRHAHSRAAAATHHARDEVPGNGSCREQMIPRRAGGPRGRRIQ